MPTKTVEVLGKCNHAECKYDPEEFLEFKKETEENLEGINSAIEEFVTEDEVEAMITE